MIRFHIDKHNFYDLFLLNLNSVPAALEFSQKMVESLLNYTASFAISADQTRLKTSETYVPFSAVQNWFTNFERRLQQNPTFWKN